MWQPRSSRAPGITHGHKKPCPWRHAVKGREEMRGHERSCGKTDEANARRSQGHCEPPILPSSTIFKRNNTLKKTCDISKTESRKLQVLAVPWTLRADGPQRPGEDAGWGEAAAPGATQSQPGGIPSKGVRKSARAACPLTPLPRPEAHALRHPFFPCSDDRENTKRTQK